MLNSPETDPEQSRLANYGTTFFWKTERETWSVSLKPLTLRFWFGLRAGDLPILRQKYFPFLNFLD
jgi:hypothetical protein